MVDGIWWLLQKSDEESEWKINTHSKVLNDLETSVKVAFNISDGIYDDHPATIPKHQDDLSKQPIPTKRDVRKVLSSISFRLRFR